MKSPIPRLILSVCLLLPVSWERADATTVLRVNVADQVDLADLIFTGQVIGTQVAVGKGGNFPFTFVTFTVTEALKGGTPSSLLTLRLLGGWTAERVVRVDGMPTFTLGESYLVFVKDNGVVDCPVLGWGQGQLRFFKDPASGKEVLLDEFGAAVTGISDGRLIRGARLAELDPGVDYVQAPSGGLIADIDTAVPTAVLTGIESQPASTSQVAEAKAILEALRSLVRDRSTGPQFRKGQQVMSAGRGDLPVVLKGSVTALPANH